MSRKVFFTTKEVSEILGVDVNTVQKWAARNGVETQKVGRVFAFMFKRDDIKRYQANRFRWGKVASKKVSIPY
jgi:excisionase family DNA binding protein